MASGSFTFKQFTIYQDRCIFKVGTDGVLLGAYAEVSGAKKILDVGSGTGLIAIMLAQKSEAEIVAIEPDIDSFKQACINVSLCKWNNRISVINSDLQNYKPVTDRFDLIVSNPPYFIDSIRNPDPGKAAARHNVTLNKNDLLRCISRLLTDDGRVQVIMPYTEGSILIAEANEFGLYCNDILKIKPLPASEVRRLILTFSRRRKNTTEKYLTVEHGKRHDFTQEYIDLTKDFYLKF